ncbi:hypothetical protein GGR57DRAFT_327192 [Xylariaceae sp. FL1272]|nr:hypothetical protein GGR57DRAFT_327192 [Xylariaceae sp. FL1272]
MPPRVRSTDTMPLQVAAQRSDGGEPIYVTHPVIPQKRRPSSHLPSAHRRRYEAAASFKKSRQRTLPMNSSRRRRDRQQSTPRYYSRSDLQPESQSRRRTNWRPRPKSQTAIATTQSAVLVLSKFLVWLILWARHGYDALNAVLIVASSIVFEGVVYDFFQSSSYPQSFTARLVLACQYIKHYLSTDLYPDVPAWLVLDVANHVVSVLSAFYRWSDLHTSGFVVGLVMLVITPQALMRSFLFTSPQRIATGLSFWLQCFAAGCHYPCHCVLRVGIAVRHLLPTHLVGSWMKSCVVLPFTACCQTFGTIRLISTAVSRLYHDSLGKVYEFNQDEESRRWWERHEKSRSRGRGMLGDYLSDIDDGSESEEGEYPDISIMRGSRWDNGYN